MNIIDLSAWLVHDQVSHDEDVCGLGVGQDGLAAATQLRAFSGFLRPARLRTKLPTHRANDHSDVRSFYC